MRKTKIVCTIGPASEDMETLEKLIQSGMNVARLNFSHGNFSEHKERIKNISKVANRLNKNLAILLDTKGPENSTGVFNNGDDMLEKNDILYVSMEEIEGIKERFSISYPGNINDVEIGHKILLDDGLIELEILEIHKEQKELKTRILN